ncbi:MAG: bifunctional glycoside hydrolase 114/ polysaccharide deacetylase family protein [Burkholderiaceae bacterium]|nr:bifunctional glycoside hydrolase 114/ polysaccharide deacetylase family protein [Burkholderiaceae bacterium]
MRLHSLGRWSLRAWLAVSLLLGTVCVGAQPSLPAPPASYAFYYDQDIPWETLGAFDTVVVEPDHAQQSAWMHRLNPGSTVAAYVSVGEIHPTRSYFAKVRPEWKLGANTAWGSIVIDQTATDWHAFYLREVIEPLWARGFRAFFLDTLDSFNLVAKTDEARSTQAAGLAGLIRAIKSAHPEARLIFNRGFEILPQVHGLAHAVVAESLFQGWDAGNQSYREVPPQDRDWLLAQLRRCRDEYGLPVVAIDYVAPQQRELARETARRIMALGITPWVSNPALNMVGVGRVEAIPREVLALHDESRHVAAVALHEIHRVGTMPLNYLGLDATHVYFDAPEMSRLSERPLIGRYAGVLTWFNRGSFPETPRVMKLLNTAREQGVPVVIVGAMPGDAALDSFGIDVGESARGNLSLKLEKRSPHVGFEMEPQPIVDSFAPLHLRQGDVWLRVTAASGQYADAIGIAPWGGFAVDRYWKLDLSQDQGERWVVNPIEFFRAALRVRPEVPVPDVTSDNGRRLLMVHVDGDGFPSKAEIPGTPLAGDVLLREFLLRYPLPTTFSLIEGETSPKGLYPALSPQLEATARRIFALDHVEIASHTYSHPFYWSDVELGQVREGRYMSLDLPNYKYNAEREIVGAARYMETLAPPGKRTRVVLWSGDTEPLETPVRLAYQAGLLNMNGGLTLITRAVPTLTQVAPLGMMKGSWYQVYAPNQNENVYTDNWNGPFYGYERVIETFEMTDLPLRLKPVNIYYHAYIATKRASISSLHKVYQWAQAQPLHPVLGSEYIERALDWRRATVARTADGAFELRGGGPWLRQWRVQTGVAATDWARSAGVAGELPSGAVRYLHMSAPVSRLALGAAAANAAPTAAAAPAPQLESANARLVRWEREGALWRIAFTGHQPLRARMRAGGCELDPGSTLRATRVAPDILDIEGSTLGTTAFLLRCAG